MNIYTKDGWLDVPHINDICDRNDINFIIIIGKRQVGKTYNVLKFMLDKSKQFIFMRRVKPEMELLKCDEYSPFEKIPEYKGKISFKSESEYASGLFKLVENGEESEQVRIGMATTLNSIAGLRGFNGDKYTDVVFDEFIPEEHLYKVRKEDSAFLNAQTTINGNRELEGRPCVRFWLLANSNNLNSGVLSALNVTEVVERMTLRGEESRLLKERGILIILPESKKIIEKRKKGGLMRAIGRSDSKFVRMAYENEFSYNDYTDVGTLPLREFNPYLTIGKITISLHKNDKTLYVTERLKAAKYTLTDSDTDIMKFNRQYSSIRMAYMNSRMTFQNMTVKNYFLDLIK